MPSQPDIPPGPVVDARVPGAGTSGAVDEGGPAGPGGGQHHLPRSGPTLDEMNHDELVAAWSTPVHEGEGRIGVLLCHGFTGSPQALREWAFHLVGQGFRVSLPLLPGHGTTWQDLNNTTWRDWYATVEAEFNLMRRECDAVFVAGLAMGGALALRLAERYGSDVTGIALVNPAIRSSDKRLLALRPVLRVVPSIGGIAGDVADPSAVEYAYRRTPLRAVQSMLQLWRDVTANLERITQPVLLFKSTTDHVVDPSSARLIAERVSSDEFTVRPLERSFHVATLDYDAPDIFAESAEFFLRHCGVENPPPQT